MYKRGLRLLSPRSASAPRSRPPLHRPGRRTTTRHVAIGPSHKTALHHRLTCGVPPRRATTPFRVPARPRDLRLSPRVRHGVRERAQRRGEIVGVAPAARGRPAAVVTRSPRLVSRVPTPYPLPSPLAPRVAPAPCPGLRGVGSGRLGCRTGARHGPRARATPRVACLYMY